MIINRHNYEDYFILYLDNELDTAGRKAVEDFLASNPDLQTEMDQFRQAILLPDESLVFDQKETLLLTGNPINIHNYNGYLVAFMDNELQPAEVKALEQFLVTYPEAYNELQLLQRTRLHPDKTLVFTNKEQLYRYNNGHEIKPAAWWHAAAAAVVILGLGAGGFLLSDNLKDAAPPVIASETIPTVNKAVAMQSNTQITDASATSPVITGEVPVADEAPATRTSSYAYNTQSTPEADRNTISPDQQGLKKPVGIPVSTADITPGNQHIYTELQQQNINDVAVTNEISTAYYPKASNEANQLMYAADMEQDNKKIRGFFRKATRIIERTTNISATNEDDKLLLGAFAISLK